MSGVRLTQCLRPAATAAVVLALGCGRSASAPPEASGGPEHVATGPAPVCAEGSSAGLERCVSVERYTEHLTLVAGRRPPGSVHWLTVQNHCDATLSALGFEVERHHYGSGYNVIGVRQGSRAPHQQVVLGAHYDHIGGCEGADDNASGVAGVLEAATVLASVEHDRTLVVACWDEEELGLVGSTAWVERVHERGDEIVVYFNFDAIAFTDSRPDTQRIPPGFGVMFPESVWMLAERDYRADFITVVTDAAARPFVEPMIDAAERRALPQSVLTIPTLLRRSHLAVDLERSDHAAFWRRGYPAVMITDTADYRSDAYHCRGRPDSLDTLDLDFAHAVVAVTTHAVAEALVAPAEAPASPDSPR